jgi:hypothetical protein
MLCKGCGLPRVVRRPPVEPALRGEPCVASVRLAFACFDDSIFSPTLAAGDADEPADRVLLPNGRLNDIAERRALGAFRQRDHCGFPIATFRRDFLRSPGLSRLLRLAAFLLLYGPADARVSTRTAHLGLATTRRRALPRATNLLCFRIRLIDAWRDAPLSIYAQPIPSIFATVRNSLNPMRDFEQIVGTLLAPMITERS